MAYSIESESKSESASGSKIQDTGFDSDFEFPIHNKGMNEPTRFEGGSPVSLKTKIIIGLVLLALIDMIIPIPITALVLLYVVFERPPWFRGWMNEIYRH